jgi:hypothetical protein
MVPVCRISAGAIHVMFVVSCICWEAREWWYQTDCAFSHIVSEGDLPSEAAGHLATTHTAPNRCGLTTNTTWMWPPLMGHILGQSCHTGSNPRVNTATTSGVATSHPAPQYSMLLPNCHRSFSLDMMCCGLEPCPTCTYTTGFIPLLLASTNLAHTAYKTGW